MNRDHYYVCTVCNPHMYAPEHCVIYGDQVCVDLSRNYVFRHGKWIYLASHVKQFSVLALEVYWNKVKLTACGCATI